MRALLFSGPSDLLPSPKRKPRFIEEPTGPFLRPRLFHLHRYEDETGVSGTGVVAEGMRATDGRVALRWLVGDSRSWSLWDSIEDVKAIHGHNGKTQVVWLV